MREKQKMSFNVAGRTHDLQGALVRLINYPPKTPVAFDFPGSGEPDRLTADEVKRTRKVRSRISNSELDFFVESGATAPWVSSLADLAEADPHGKLFMDMTDLYWHFSAQAPKGVNFAKISKVLHIKNPRLYPILDSHIKRSYAPAAKALRSQYKALGWRRRTWIAIRNDLVVARSSGALTELRELLRAYESPDTKEQQRVRNLDSLTDLRILDILVW